MRLQYMRENKGGPTLLVRMLQRNSGETHTKAHPWRGRRRVSNLLILIQKVNYRGRVPKSHAGPDGL